MDTQDITKKQIVLIEDDERLRNLYKAVLGDAGFEVLEAAETTKGLELIKTINWNLLLLDVMLPGNDGVSLLKQIADEKLKKGKIVMLTNINNEEVIKDSFRYSADGYIIKANTDPISLIKEVNNYLAND